MRPSSRPLIGRTLPPSHVPVCPKFVCLACLKRTYQPSASRPFNSTALRYKHDLTRRDQEDEEGEKASLPFRERMRRKIWGTDQPPGQKDPYARKGTPGAAPNVPKKKPRKEPDSSLAAADDYVPAVTWDGLEQVGGASGWWEEAWDKEHPFKGCALLLIYEDGLADDA